MEENKNLLEEYQQDTKLPQMLNVLTILTFIGSGFGALGILAMPITCKMMDKLQDQPGMTEKAIDAMNKMCANIGLTLAYTIIGALLCIIGAVQMRKRKKMGFVFYLAGTFIPFILNIILNGMESVTIDTKTMVISVLGTLLFPILYATQLKELTK
jgi:sulfite exporter TauE/SafE